MVFFLGILAIASNSWAQSGPTEFLFIQKKIQEGLVAEIIRGDVIRLESGEKIRLIGINAPEPPRREKIEKDKDGFVVEVEKPETPLDERAYAFVENLLVGKKVRIEFDSQLRDESFRTFGYVFLLPENIFVNAEIVRQGFADLQIRPPNHKYEQELREAYREARQEKRGVHGD